MPAATRSWILFSLLCAALGSLVSFAPAPESGRSELCAELTAGSWVHLEYCHPGGLGAARHTVP